MADEPEQPEGELGSLQVEAASEAEYVEVEGAMIVACRGWADV